MGKKKRRHPDVEELLARPWCYYCERDFEDLKLLISHQKAKHFKCDRCGRRLNTAGGLSVHMNQVHKESLSTVENALPNRQGLEVEIFGMEGIPEDIVQQHHQRIIQNYYQAQAERQSATGNPPSGQGRTGQARKKIKYETPEELKTRLREYVTRRKAEMAAGIGSPADAAQPNAQFSPAGQQYPPQFPPGGAPPPGAFAGMPTSILPARPPGANLPAPPGLPQRPQQYGSGPGGYWSGSGGSGNASTVDELVASASRPSDDIDQIIRMAEAGIKPPGKEEEKAAAAEKSKKKDKARMQFSDNNDMCPEEFLGMISRYT